MNPKKTPRPKPRKNPNRLSRRIGEKPDLSRRSAAKTDTSQQTCLHCRYWSMWDGSCAARAMALDDFSPIAPDTPACKEFQPE